VKICNELVKQVNKNMVSQTGSRDLGKESPTFPAALLSVDARFARKIERPQTEIK